MPRLASCAWQCWSANRLVGGCAGQRRRARPTISRDVAAAVEQFADQFGPEHVLLVLDIDNTLLAMNNDLGSDQWFEWQKYLLENEPKSKLRSPTRLTAARSAGVAVQPGARCTRRKRTCRRSSAVAGAGHPYAGAHVARARIPRGHRARAAPQRLRFRAHRAAGSRPAGRRLSAVRSGRSRKRTASRKKRRGRVQARRSRGRSATRTAS